ncbi:hypothetical protein [Aeromonas sp.]|uniref:hypothetical protein n=1 Tax=Aeromonas sp. TaxID=647 RepID=UPI002586D54E|nr:hypothetical protein [Aeromonas sp.]MCX7127045.1 hypothetical protein [Aeromonas sp.]
MMEKFDVPVVLIIFRRVESTLRVLERISSVKPNKLYILSDQGRTDVEKDMVEKCRSAVENAINWDCEVVKDYAMENRGVYENIALGVKRVFEVEDRAIVLEDDNLPETSFFWFCKKVLEYHEHNENVLWVCGTNYLENYSSNEDYLFTKNMMPCGWASWSKKFNKYYDDKFDAIDVRSNLKKIKNSYLYRPLFKQDLMNWLDEKYRWQEYGKPSSWDYQMSLTMRAFDLYAIVPTLNQIKNIGFDNLATHGGNDLSQEMTKRFCNLKTKEIIFPIRNNNFISVNKDFEIKLAKIITYPKSMRYKRYLARLLKMALGMSVDKSFKEMFK